MKLQRAQKGASVPMTLLFLAMASVILTVSFKLYPAYYDNWLVGKILVSFEDEPGLKDKGIDEIEKMFNKRLVTNGVNSFDPEEGLIIEMDEDGIYIGIDYQVTVSIYSNTDAVVKFEDSFEKSF